MSATHLNRNVSDANDVAARLDKQDKARFGDACREFLQVTDELNEARQDIKLVAGQQQKLRGEIEAFMRQTGYDEVVVGNQRLRLKAVQHSRKLPQNKIRQRLLEMIQDDPALQSRVKQVFDERELRDGTRLSATACQNLGRARSHGKHQ